MTAIMQRRSECKGRMLKRCQSLFERAKKLQQLSPSWTPRIAAMTLQALMNGLIVIGLEQRKGFHLAKSGPACIKAFFESLRA
jgi:hypothetical protein